MTLLKQYYHSGLRFIWLAFIVLALDRISKNWMVDNLTLFEPVKVLPVLNFTLFYNTGAAFSFLHNASGWQNWLLGGLAFVVSAFILVWLRRISSRERWVGIALCLVLAGALGNAWDRVLYGYVIDFISVHWQDWYFAIFNVADSAICIGAAMLFLYWIKFPK